MNKFLGFKATKLLSRIFLSMRILVILLQLIFYAALALKFLKTIYFNELFLQWLYFLTI